MKMTIKILDKQVATSILIDRELLNNCPDLRRVAQNGENVYYNVIGTNTCIMHVEQCFCILTTYLTKTFKDVEDVNLAWMMSANRYGVYQLPCGRDIVRNTLTRRSVGYDILEMVYGNGVRTRGTTQEHYVETWNEKMENIAFITDNVNRGSHRVKVEIYTIEDLEELIDRIKKMDGKRGWLYPELVKNPKTLNR
ncbi:MAG: hypothetical protein K6G88_07965 [Lachnospiraceae bacterium]|nr:hypothetical protein [Lachnospiraceae bacterium]